MWCLLPGETFHGSETARGITPRLPSFLQEVVVYLLSGSHLLFPAENICDLKETWPPGVSPVSRHQIREQRGNKIWRNKEWLADVISQMNMNNPKARTGGKNLQMCGGSDSQRETPGRGALSPLDRTERNNSSSHADCMPALCLGPKVTVDVRCSASDKPLCPLHPPTVASFF